MGHNYSSKDYNKENMARAIGRSLPISFKYSVEICNFVRNKDVDYVKDVLNNVIKKQQAIPLKRFNMNIGHKKRMATGRYPKKASMEILNLINHVEANAQFKGLNTASLVITQINANKASKVIRFGRKRNRESKRTNVEIVVQEKADKKPKEKKEAKKIADKKPEKKQKSPGKKEENNVKIERK
tara:strand:- start:746 stop:1297 length:552 start_codon:yes stop_codon:yes gene_type:complete